MATNRADTLDPALMRPGRLDRKIEFPNPDRRQKWLVIFFIFGTVRYFTVNIFFKLNNFFDGSFLVHAQLKWI